MGEICLGVSRRVGGVTGLGVDNRWLARGGDFCHAGGVLALRAMLLLGAFLVTSAAALAGPGAGASAPGENPIVRSWGTEAGLPQSTVNSIVQTRDGYLWIATQDGLARFDGVRFTVFGLEQGLSAVEIYSLYEDRQGTLWAGTVGGGLNRLVGERFEVVRRPEGESGAGPITSFAEDGQGRLWIAGTSGLRILEAGRFVEEPALKELATTFVRRLLFDRQGGMWLATHRGGLFRYYQGQLTPQPGPPGNELVNAYCLLEDRQGRLWAGVGNGRVLCLEQGVWRVYSQSEGVPFAFTTSLVEDGQGTIWAGSLDDGLYRLEQGRFRALHREQGLSAEDIRCLLTDREGNLWVGTRTGGLNRLSRRRLLHYGVAQGLTNDFTRGVAESADGTLWVAATGGGLYRGGERGFQAFAPNDISRFYAHPETVLVSGDGGLWWGGGGALLCWKDNRFAHCYTNEPWMRDFNVTALCEDGQGGMWVGTAGGVLARERNGQLSLFPGPLVRGAVTGLARESDGGLWVGSRSGDLKRVRWGETNVLAVTNGLLSRAILTLHLDREQTLWIGTAGGGLSRRRGNHIATFTSQHGLGANTIAQIVEDDLGCLWLGCNRGIIRVRKSELEDLAAGRASFLHPQVYGVNDGMATEECASGFCPAGLKTRSGLICFSTVKGLVMVDPHQSESNAPPEVLLEEVLVNGKVLPYRASPPPATPAAEFVIPPGGRDVELHYTGIDFASPEKLSFRYRLEGLQKDWVEAGRRRTAYYDRLPPGHYEFQVAACAANGLWNERPAVLRIDVQPYLWETMWFRFGVGLVLVGALAGTLRVLERRKYRRRLKELEMQHAVERERLRISQDMHDHVGGMLTQVSQLSDLGQGEEGTPGTRRQFERIGVQARNAVQALDEIVWATNPKNDNLPRFAEYVCRFADEFFETSAVRCWQEVPTTLPPLGLTADVRHDVFLAVKEAFHNVVKHSKAKEVWLRLTWQEGEACLEIEDNGCGFDLGDRARWGDGLENMKARLTECRGAAEFDSVPGKGTRVRFRFPLQAPG